MVLCPKCGKVEKYHIEESANRFKIFNKDGECVETFYASMYPCNACTRAQNRKDMYEIEGRWKINWIF